MSRHSLLLLLCPVIFLLGAVSARAAGTVMQPSVDPRSGIDIHLNSWLESCPPFGIVPIRVEIANRTNAPHTWEVRAQDGYGADGTIISSTAITVDAGRTASTMLYVLTKPLTGTYGYYRNMNFVVSGHGVTSGMTGGLRSASSGSGTATEFVAMSTTLSSKGWSQLKSLFGTSSGSTSRRFGSFELDGVEVEMKSAPTDWRGFSGLNQLWLAESDWVTMNEGAKAAMMEWVALGGSVMVMTEDTGDAKLEQLKFPAGAGTKRRHGLGRITAWLWNGKTLPVDGIAQAIKDADDHSLRKQLGEYNPAKWSLHKLVGDLGLKHGLIFGFVAVFGILMGPVNLFLLAPASRRHRLFVTVPALSVLGSALLVSLMILQDGMGGNGARLTLALLMPEQKKMLLRQEQVSRTGVLLKRSFASDETSWMQPLPLGDSSSLGRMRDMNHHYNENPFERSGDWFTSRAIQAQLITTSRPTRAAIEFTAGEGDAPPSVLSTVEVPLDKLFVVDAAKKVWSAENVGTGEKKVLRASTETDFNAWMKSRRTDAGPVVAAALDDLASATGYAFAEAASGSKVAVKTLASIRWNNDRVIYAGPCMKP